MPFLKPSEAMIKGVAAKEEGEAAVLAGCAHRSQACAVGLGNNVCLLPYVLPDLQEECASQS